jgi:hypothetical protein
MSNKKEPKKRYSYFPGIRQSFWKKKTTHSKRKKIIKKITGQIGKVIR